MARRFATAIERGFYQRDTERVARELLGKLLVRADGDGLVALRLSEVEAYLGVDDPAAHTFRGRRTERVRSMWGEAGHAYVYLVYGLHHCLNLVTMGEGIPHAVLIRGGQVVAGTELVRRRRGPRVAPRAWTDGPGKLAQALALSRADDGLDVCDPTSGLWLVDDGVVVPEDQVARTPRIGVDYAGDAASWPLRFVVAARV